MQSSTIVNWIRFAGSSERFCNVAMADIRESIEELAYYREHFLSL